MLPALTGALRKARGLGDHLGGPGGVQTRIDEVTTKYTRFRGGPSRDRQQVHHIWFQEPPSLSGVYGEIKSEPSKPDESFFSIDEFGPFAIKTQGGLALAKAGQIRSIPQYQRSKGRLIVTAALELSTNQVTHFYSDRKNTEEMLRMLDVLLDNYVRQRRIYFSWDAASWHGSKRFFKRVEEVNSASYREKNATPEVELAPLPACAQFLNVIESVFSGMARAIIHNSDYQSVGACKQSIDRYFAERNAHFRQHPQKADKKIWGKERVPAEFSPAHNCKDPRW